MGEIWKDIPGFSSYQVSNQGRIRSRASRWPVKSGAVREWRLRKTRLDYKGYPRVALCRHGKNRHIRVHRLVLGAFVGPCPPGHEACHRNGIKHDNRPENLYWGTLQENRADRKRLGEKMGPIGEEHGQSKLTELDVLEIRRLASTGMLQAKIAKRFAVNRRQVNNVVRRKYWKHI